MSDHTEGRHGISAILSRDVAYYLLNVPSLDASTTPAEALKRGRGKYHHFALRAVDAFILYDRLYYDFTVPVPLEKQRLPYWIWRPRDLFRRNDDVAIEAWQPSETQQAFYKKLKDSGCLHPAPISEERFEAVFKDACDGFVAVARELPAIWGEMLRITPNFDRRFYTNQASGLLAETSIFYGHTGALMGHLEKRISRLMETVRREGGYGDYTIHAPWVFSAILCDKLQQELDLPGVYSTFSYPYCSYNLRGRTRRRRDDVQRGVFRGALEYYRSLASFKVELRVPSFSTWCAGTGQTSKDRSNQEILERALDIRSNPHVAGFRRRLLTIVEKILSETSEGPSDRAVSERTTTQLAGDVRDLLDSLEPSIKRAVKQVTMQTLIGLPLAFLGPLASIPAGIAKESMQQVTDMRHKRNLGWLFFLHDEISGYPLMKEEPEN
jgi:hypothetical protein